MNSHLAEELLNEPGSSLESLETRNTAVRWRATRVRLERVFASATEAEEKAFEKLREQAPKAQTPRAPAEQDTSANRQPENAAKKTEAKKDSTDETKKAGEAKKGGDESKPVLNAVPSA
jgi:hypothetical protein